MENTEESIWRIKVFKRDNSGAFQQHPFIDVTGDEELRFFLNDIESPTTEYQKYRFLKIGDPLPHAGKTYRVAEIRLIFHDHGLAASTKSEVHILIDVDRIY